MSKQKHKKKDRDRRATLASVVAPDDLGPGDYICVLSETHELVPFSLCGSEFRPLTVQRVTLTPDETDPPVLVESVCVPFVLVQDSAGKRRMIDLRRFRLARVSRDFGARAFRALRSADKRGAD